LARHSPTWLWGFPLFFRVYSPEQPDGRKHFVILFSGLRLAEWFSLTRRVVPFFSLFLVGFNPNLYGMPVVFFLFDPPKPPSLGASMTPPPAANDVLNKGFLIILFPSNFCFCSRMETVISPTSLEDSWFLFWLLVCFLLFSGCLCARKFQRHTPPNISGLKLLVIFSGVPVVLLFSVGMGTSRPQLDFPFSGPGPL